MDSNNTAGLEALERGVVAHRAGRLEEALLEYQAALSAAPGDAETASLTGLALVHCGRPAEALPFLNQAVASEPEQMGFRFNLAEGLIAVRDGALAEEQLRVILARYPETPQAWERLGDVALLRQDVDAAAKAWRRAFDSGPGLSSGLKLARHELSGSRVAAPSSAVTRAMPVVPASRPAPAPVFSNPAPAHSAPKRPPAPVTPVFSDVPKPRPKPAPRSSGKKKS